MTAIEPVDPSVNFRFGVEIAGVVVGWFTECSNLTLEREILPHPEGGVNSYIHQLPGRLKSANITLKRGLADNQLWDWLQQGAYDGQVTRRNVSVIRFNPDQTEANRWELTNTYPVKWSGANFNSGNQEIAIETLELVQGEANVSAANGSTSSVQRSFDDSPEPTDQRVDLPALAQKVYALLKQELRIERDRIGRNRPW